MPYSPDFGISDPDYLKHSRLMINKMFTFLHFNSIPISNPFHSHHPYPSCILFSCTPTLLSHSTQKKETPKKINNTFQDCIPCLPLNSSESDLYNFLVLTEFKKCFLLLNFALFCNVLFFSHHICW